MIELEGTPRVLIVDDSALTRRKIAEALKDDGYQLHEADSAEAALAWLGENRADLFLFDILMPEMDGLELCRQVKSRPELAEIPVLFVTAATEMEPHWRTFEIGAVDYIPKPFNPLELRARVRVHLKLRQAVLHNRRFAGEMEALAAQRAQQLVHADRLAAIGVLTAGIIHELRTPLTYISNNSQSLKKIVPELADAARYAIENGYEPSKILKAGMAFLDETLEGLAEGVDCSRTIIEDIRRYSRRYPVQSRTVSLSEILHHALTITRNRLKYIAKIENEVPDDLPPMRGETNSLSQVFVNLLLNAADACEETEQAVIRIEAEEDGQWIRCRLSDNGAGMDADTIRRIWEPFFSTKDADVGTGLGLSISRQIIEESGGEIRVDSAPGEGSRFTLLLPKA